MEVTEFTRHVKRSPLDPFRRAVLRGLAVLLPPLLTIVIFLWVGNTVADYLLDPCENFARRHLPAFFDDSLPASAVPDEESVPSTEADGATADREPMFVFGERAYRKADDGRYVPAEHYDEVRKLVGQGPMPKSANEIYQRYVEHTFLQRHIVIPIFLSLFLLVLYLLGKFLAAGVGRFFWMQMERLINRLPLVRNVYSSVKQISDFMFSEREIEYTRVVAIEYPRRGVWSLAMVTGESMLDIRCAANEPVVSVLIPSSPMPVTGYTVTVKKSEVVDLNITIEQAFQFIVSCGVVVPPQQLAKALTERHPPDAKFPQVLTPPRD